MLPVSNVVGISYIYALLESDSFAVQTLSASPLMTLTKDAQPEDNSTYNKFLAIYTRDSDYDLLTTETKGGFELIGHWKHFTDMLITAFTERYVGTTQYNEMVLPVTLFPDDFIPDRWAECNNIVVIEHLKPGEAHVRGLVLADYASGEAHLAEFHRWFAKLILRDSRLQLGTVCAIQDKDYVAASQVTDFFALTLKNAIQCDQWEHGGRDYFLKRAHYFTSRNLRIECVLPAFPCKSSNTNKVHAAEPDKGEELALRRLMEFSRETKDIYPPGLKVLVVSDGHVFSDCIGVDDDVVDLYTEQLKALYYTICQSEKTASKDLIGFVSLKDLFFGNGLDCLPKFVETEDLPHYTGTKICEDSELSRKLLMAGCDTDAGKLRRDIDTPNHPRLNLYRGFWRFMKEDLSVNNFCQTLSKKAFKKTVSTVAFEMIKRNDAYSNLVELMFPHHLRLSIHAHNNAGPKYGVKLLAPGTSKIIKTLDSSDEPSFEDLLHIPTPWHNAVVTIEGHPFFYMTKSKTVLDAIAAGHYDGEWVPANADKGHGGHYHIYKTV